MNNLYKAQISSTYKWIWGNYLTFKDSEGECHNIIIPQTYYGSFGYNFYKPYLNFIDGFAFVKMDTVCQATGFYDKNGDMIFENDILKLESDYDQFRYWKVIWYKEMGSFRIVQIGGNMAANLSKVKRGNGIIIRNEFDKPGYIRG
jgi:uncharacterized phage protein (TIGR01671 family)